MAIAASLGDQSEKCFKANLGDRLSRKTSFQNPEIGNKCDN